MHDSAILRRFCQASSSNHQKCSVCLSVPSRRQPDTPCHPRECSQHVSTLNWTGIIPSWRPCEWMQCNGSLGKFHAGKNEAEDSSKIWRMTKGLSISLPLAFYLPRPKSSKVQRSDPKNTRTQKRLHKHGSYRTILRLGSVWTRHQSHQDDHTRPPTR